MRPTDFCFPSLCQRAPAPRRLPFRGRFDPITSGEWDTSRYPARFGGPRALFRHRGVFFPVPRRSTEPLTPRRCSELPRGSAPYFFGAATTLPESLGRLFRDPRDGITAPSTRGAFHRPVPRPQPGCRHFWCRLRAMPRVFPDLAALHTATRFSTPLRSRRPRFSLARLARAHRSLDPVHVNWPFG